MFMQNKISKSATIDAIVADFVFYNIKFIHSRTRQ